MMTQRHRRGVLWGCAAAMVILGVSYVVATGRPPAPPPTAIVPVPPEGPEAAATPAPAPALAEEAPQIAARDVAPAEIAPPSAAPPAPVAEQPSPPPVASPAESAQQASAPPAVEPPSPTEPPAAPTLQASAPPPTPPTAPAQQASMPPTASAPPEPAPLHNEPVLEPLGDGATPGASGETPEVADAAAAPNLFSAPLAPTAPTPSHPLLARERYALVTPVPEGWPRIAIVIDGLGVDPAITAHAIALSNAVELSFVAYGAKLAAQSAAARQVGHELLVHVPMGAFSQGNVARAEFLRRLDGTLDRFPEAVGVYDHMDAGYVEVNDATATLIGDLAGRGLLLLESRLAAKSIDADVARQHGVPIAGRDLFIDDARGAAAIAARLAAVEDMARKHGRVVAIGHATDDTITALAAWLPTLPQKHLALAPLTEVAEPPGSE